MNRSNSLVVSIALALAVGHSALPESVAADTVAWEATGFQGEGEARLQSADRRSHWIEPTLEQKTMAETLGASILRWNRFGTPYVMFNHEGYLSGPASGSAAELAHDWLMQHRELFRLTVDQVRAMEVLRVSPLYDAPDLVRVRDGLEPINPDVATVVLFRQRAGDLFVAWDGLLNVGVSRDGRIGWVASTVTADSATGGSQVLDSVAALHAAAADVGMNLGSLERFDLEWPGVWNTFSSSLLRDVQRTRLVAFPTVEQGLRLAWEATLLKGTHDEDGEPQAWISFVDAETGQVWLRENRVDYLTGVGDVTIEDNGATKPNWRVFPTNPPLTFGAGAGLSAEDRDIRELWCWGSDDAAEGCAEDVFNLASRMPWDVNPIGFVPSLTTDGNNASAAISHVSFLTPDTVTDRPVAPLRAYEFEFNDVWNQSQCDPGSFLTDNDDAASTVNLWVMHNRMHDYSYFLGLTETNGALQKSNFGNTSATRENDPELGQAQAGRLTFNGRDNANQITLQDGIPGITNQYLWQPLAGAFYAPCVDGAFDMPIISHEYGHAVSNRLTAGPDSTLGSTQGQSEGWSDLIWASFYLDNALEVVEEGINPFALAPYATGNPEAGVRNFGMNRSPLNYSNIDYDGMGLTSPHANGEIWAAVNFVVQEALSRKFDDAFPSADADLQRSCANGQLAAQACPGNRRWSQLMFDGMLLQPSGPNQLVSRDAMIVGDLLRFDGENQFELWDAFASRGFGFNAESGPGNDRNPTPDWTNPLRDEHVTTRFELVDAFSGDPVAGEIRVGVFEARVTPAADTHAGTALGDTVSFVPGRYEFLARADGYGMVRTAADLFETGPDEQVQRVVRIEMRPNLASLHQGASAAGDGVNHHALIDDTEATNWASLEGDVMGRQVTVSLARRALVTDVQVSAMLRGNTGDANDPGGQNRFTSLRAFDLFACDAQTADCTDEAAWHLIRASNLAEFESGRPRPLAPDMRLKGFDVEDAVATHVRLVVVSSQCTGNELYSTESNPVNDPVFAVTGCADPDEDPAKAGGVLNPPVEQVRAAELQVFGLPADAMPEPAVLDLDDADPAIEYVGGWHRRSSDAASHGGYHRRVGGNGADGSGASPSARLVFTGNRVTYFYGLSENGGTAEVLVDGKFVTMVDYAGAADRNDPAFGESLVVEGLADGEHEIVILQRSGAVNVDGFRVESDSPDQPASADTDAVAYRSVTERVVLDAAGSMLGALTQGAETTIEVGSADKALSIEINDAPVGLVLELLGPLGLTVANAELPVFGAIYVLDALVSGSGSYTIRAVSLDGLTGGIAASVARTQSVQNP